MLHPKYDNGCDDNNPYALNQVAPNRVYLSLGMVFLI